MNLSGKKGGCMNTQVFMLNERLEKKVFLLNKKRQIEEEISRIDYLLEVQNSISKDVTIGFEDALALSTENKTVSELKYKKSKMNLELYKINMKIEFTELEKRIK